MSVRLLLTIVALASCTQSKGRRPLSQGSESHSRTSLPGTLHPLARPEFDLGRMNGAAKVEGASILFKLSPAQESDLDALLAAQQNPSSPQFHRWLTPEQYAARFETSQDIRDRAASWLSEEGLQVVGFSRSGTRLFFSGTIDRIERALATEVHHFQVRGERHFALATAPSVPSAFADFIQGFRGLDDFRPHHRRRLHANFTASTGGTDYHFLVPEDLTTIYDLQGLYDEGLGGSGSSVAVVEQTYYYPDDVTNFRSLSGLSTIDLQNVEVPNSGNSTYISAPDLEEAELDVEWAGAVARNARIVTVYTGDNPVYSVWDALQYAIDNDVAQVISSSYTSCEQQEPASFATYLRSLIKQANAQGITVVAATGDSGAAGCDDGMSPPATSGPAVSLPASVPEVTAVGGTTFDEGAGTYWNSVNDANSGSVLTYIPEVSWNDTSDPLIAGTAFAASAGGASMIFARPVWQAGPGVPGDGARDVPDVSMNASWVHDGYMVCVNGGCKNGWGNTTGGTSASAPVFAGLIALVNQAVGSSGLGNVNPTLYQLAGTAPNAFHDITSGDNIVPCQQGSTGCPANAPYQFGYTANAGYDLVTGLGSVDAYNLVTAWESLPSATTTVLTANNAIALAGSSITLTATMATGRRQPMLSGSVTFSTGATSLGTAVLQAATDSTGLEIGTATLSTSALPVGMSSVTATYSGDSQYLASTSNAVQLAVAAPLRVSPSTAQVPPRGSVRFNVTGGQGPFIWSLSTNASGGSIDPATGAYTAGATGEVKDVVQVSDSAGEQLSIRIEVTAGISLSPAMSQVPPRGTAIFSATGGSGEGYAWSLTEAPSGGSVTNAGVYTAGPIGEVTDVVQVTDPLGNVASMSVGVGPVVSVIPATASVPASGQLRFAAQGGSGTGYTWSMVRSDSGGSIAASGQYTAGPMAGVSDVVQVVDSLGNAATGTVEVITDAAPDAGRGSTTAASGCGCSGSGSNAESLGLVLLMVAKAFGSTRRRALQPLR